MQFLLVFKFQLKYFFLVTILIICGQLWHCYIYFVIFIIQLFVYIISYTSKVSKSKWIIIIIVLQYTEGTVNNQYTLYVKVSMVTKSEVSQCKFMYVHRVCALNVALFLIDQETIHANKHKKFQSLIRQYLYRNILFLFASLLLARLLFFFSVEWRLRE